MAEFKFSVAILPENIWQFLHEFEIRIRKAVKGIGRMDHESWRRFQNDARSEDSFGVVDGDLVEQYFVSDSERSRSHVLYEFI